MRFSRTASMIFKNTMKLVLASALKMDIFWINQGNDSVQRKP